MLTGILAWLLGTSTPPTAPVAQPQGGGLPVSGPPPVEQ